MFERPVAEVEGGSAPETDLTTGTPGGEPRGGRSFWLMVGGATAAGALIRFIYAFFVQVDQTFVGDAFYYHYQAQYLLEGKLFVNPFLVYWGYTHGPELYSAVHPPFFTVFLFLGDIVGLKTLGAQKALEVVVGVATIPTISALVKRIAGTRAGVIAAVLAAFYPGLWIYDGEVLSEAPLILLVSVMLLLVYRAKDKPSTGRLIWVGVLCALCALDRAELILAIPLVALPLVWGLRKDGVRLPPKQRVKSGVIVLAALSLVLAPWFIRNLLTFEHPVWLSDQLDVTLAAANNNSTYYSPFFGSWCYPCLSEGAKVPDADESVQAIFYKKRAEKYIESHLSRLPVVLAARVGLTWGVYAPGAQAQASRVEGWPYPVTVAWLLWYYVLAVIAVCGAVVLRRRKTAIYPLVAMPVIVTIAVLVTYGDYRFRAEAEVAIVALAAIGIDALVGVLLGRRGTRLRSGRPGNESRTDSQVELQAELQSEGILR